ncbi:MAG: type VI secretion system tip protein VgrG [Symploca sp. SIO1B1]|nr:type VI secretion system tip protein VgrG [Symploca sp. SIO1B1]
MVLTATIINITQDQYMLPRVHLMYIDVIREVNKIPTAQLIVLDGDAAKQKFSISNSNFFAPGQEIQIKLRDDKNKDQTIFEGIIVRHRIKTDKNGSYLTLDLKDQAFKLTTQRNSKVFKRQNDIEIITSILESSEISNQIQLTIDEKIGKTLYKHQELVQYYCTDWDFILSRADANGQWVLIDNGQIKIQIIPIEYGNKADHTFNYGIDVIYDFEMEIDSRQLTNQVEITAWDLNSQELSIIKKPPLAPPLVMPDPRPNILNKSNNPLEWAQKIGSEPGKLVNSISLSEEEIKNWAAAKQIKSRMSMIKGHIKVDGNGEIKLGNLIEIKGIGNHFNGTTIVTGVRHQVSENGWLTDVQFGLSADWFSQRNDIVDTPAAGLVPAINGLHIGIVQDVKEADPEGHYRIQVWVPAFGEKKEAIVWARWSSPYAGKERGMFFKPEKDDEVVLGFFNDDPRQAVILGSMYSKANPPNEVFVDNNSEDKIQGIVTKDGNKILLVDSADPDFCNILDNLIKLSEEGIEINNKFDDNLIELNAQGIEIDTKQEVNIKTKSKGFNANKLQA